MSRHRIATAAALTLALAASAPASASASPHPRGTGPCSEVCSGGGYGRLAATPASVGPCSEVCSGRGYGQSAATPACAGTRSEVVSGGGYGSASVPPTVVRLVAATSGFAWGDAGIGAAATLGLMLAAIGATLLFVRRRSDTRTRTDPRTAS